MSEPGKRFCSFCKQGRVFPCMNSRDVEERAEEGNLQCLRILADQPSMGERGLHRVIMSLCDRKLNSNAVDWQASDSSKDVEIARLVHALAEARETADVSALAKQTIDGLTLRLTKQKQELENARSDLSHLIRSVECPGLDEFAELLNMVISKRPHSVEPG
jgi:hypothetical protein